MASSQPRLAGQRVATANAEPANLSEQIALLERKLACAEAGKRKAELLLKQKSRELADKNAQLESSQQSLAANLEFRTRLLLKAQSLSNIATLTWNFSEKRLDVSPQLNSLFGLPDEYRIENVRQLLHRVEPLDRPKLTLWMFAELPFKLKKGVEAVFDFRLIKQPGDDETRWMRLRTQVDQLEQNAALVLFATFHDITQIVRGRRESEVLHARDERRLEDLQHLNAELLSARRSAERANIAKTRFLAMMSHDIRTPLNGMIGMLALLEEAGLSQEQLRNLELARTSGKQLQILLNDIIDLARAEAGRFDLNPKPADLPDLLRERADFWMQAAADKGLDLDVDLSNSLPEWIEIDAARLRQLVDNFLSNAIKYTETGKVRLQAAAKDRNHFRVEVCDTGIGIPEDRMDEIFQDFGQLFMMKDDPSGAGLGLAICQKIVDVMGGAIGIERLEQGSCFWFEIPFTRSAATQTVAAEEVNLLTPQGKIPRVLVAEDIATNRLVVQGMLRKVGCEIDLVENGKEALEAVQNTEYDIVLMDMTMPIMDGPQATSAIRALPGPVSQIPIIALTAYSRPEELTPMLEAGANGSAVKPIVIAALCREMNRAMARRC